MAQYLRSLGLIPSEPVALVGSMDRRAEKVPGSEMDIIGRVEDGGRREEVGGGGEEENEKTEWT